MNKLRVVAKSKKGKNLQKIFSIYGSDRVAMNLRGQICFKFDRFLAGFMLDEKSKFRRFQHYKVA